MVDIMKKVYGQDGFDKRLYRREVSRLAAIANKRVKRLENNDLTDSPAYQKLVENGSPKFGIKGKTFNQVQQEFSRLNRFLNSETSTIRGINKNLKTMAANTGVKYKNMTELKAMTKNFFNLASKVEQYLRTVDDMASAIGYNKIWEVINEYVKSESVDLANAENSIDELTEMVTNLIRNEKGNDGEFAEDLFGDFILL